MIRLLALPALFILLVALPLGCATEPPPSVDVDAEPGRPEVDLDETLRTADPNDPETQLELGERLAEAGRAEEAIDAFDRVLLLDPSRENTVSRQRTKYLRLYQEQAKRLIETGDWMAADQRLDRADRMVPDDDRTHFLRGTVARAQGDSDFALEQFRLAHAADPGDDDRREALVGALVDRGRELYDADLFPEAAQLLDEAATVERSADLAYLRGTVAYAWARSDPDTLVQQRELAHAVDQFREVLRKDRDDDDARYNLGAVLLASYRFEEAAEIYHELIERHPREEDLYFALARAHSLAGTLEPAAVEEAIGRALATGDPVEDPATWARRAADRFPRSELAQVYLERVSPEEIRTYTLPGGDLVEVWFYWREEVIEAFREGGRLGAPFDID